MIVPPATRVRIYARVRHFAHRCCRRLHFRNFVRAQLITYLRDGGPLDLQHLLTRPNERNFSMKVFVSLLALFAILCLVSGRPQQSFQSSPISGQREQGALVSTHPRVDPELKLNFQSYFILSNRIVWWAGFNKPCKMSKGLFRTQPRTQSLYLVALLTWTLLVSLVYLYPTACRDKLSYCYFDCTIFLIWHICNIVPCCISTVRKAYIHIQWNKPKIIVSIIIEWY